MGIGATLTRRNGYVSLEKFIFSGLLTESCQDLDALFKSAKHEVAVHKQAIVRMLDTGTLSHPQQFPEALKAPPVIRDITEKDAIIDLATYSKSNDGDGHDAPRNSGALYDPKGQSTNMI